MANYKCHISNMREERLRIAYISNASPTVLKWFTESQAHHIIDIFEDAAALFLRGAGEYDEYWVDENHEDAQDYKCMQLLGGNKITIISLKERRKLARNSQ